MLENNLPEHVEHLKDRRTIHVESQSVVFAEIDDPEGSIDLDLTFRSNSVKNFSLTLDDSICEHFAVDTSVSQARERSIRLPSIPVGYHTLTWLDLESSLQRVLTILVHPRDCYVPKSFKQQKFLMLQLYAVRSDSNWGIGDFSDLKFIMKNLPETYSFVGVNPLHALDILHPQNASPYSPDSRLLLNEIYLDIEKVCQRIGAYETAKLAKSAPIHAECAALRQENLVNYQSVYQLKLKFLQAAFVEFCDDAHEAGLDFGKEFDDFCASVPAEVARAIKRRSSIRGCVEELGENRRVLFEFFLQWQARLQLQDAISTSPTNLFTDLAVGCLTDGSDAAEFPDFFDNTVSLGAPPDEICLSGQKWNIAPLKINALRRDGYRLFGQILRQNMTSNGAIRIDHIIGFDRMFQVPVDQEPSRGRYVEVPFDEFVAVLALESHRSKCLVIGEDLGSVPDGLRDALFSRRILGSLVYLLEFDEMEAGEVKAERITSCLFSFGTHDIAPILSFFESNDLKKIYALGKITADTMAQETHERLAILKTLDSNYSLLLDTATGRLDFFDALNEKFNASYCAISVDDILGEKDPVNIPGTDLEYSNWRRKYNCDCRSMIGQIGSKT